MYRWWTTPPPFHDDPIRSPNFGSSLGYKTNTYLCHDSISRSYFSIDIPRVKTAILDPTAVENGTKAWICSSCVASLSNKEQPTPPRSALANGLYLIPLPPDLQDITEHEAILVAKLHRTHNISTICNGTNTVLKSHTYTVIASPGPIITQFPAEERKAPKKNS